MTKLQQHATPERSKGMFVIFSVVRNDGRGTTVSIDSALAERMTEVLGSRKELGLRIRELAAKYVESDSAAQSRSAFVAASLRKALISYERNQRIERISFGTPVGGCSSISLPRAIADEAAGLLGGKPALNELVREAARKFNPKDCNGTTRSAFVVAEVRRAMNRVRLRTNYTRIRVFTENGKMTTVSVTPALADSASRTLGGPTQVHGLVRKLAQAYKPNKSQAPNRSAHVRAALEHLVMSC